MTLNAEPDWSLTKSSGARFHEHDSLLIASSTIAREERERERERERDASLYRAGRYARKAAIVFPFPPGERRIESPASR
jgi:hypothetical protein